MLEASAVRYDGFVFELAESSFQSDRLNGVSDFISCTYEKLYPGATYFRRLNAAAFYIFLATVCVTSFQISSRSSYLSP